MKNLQDLIELKEDGTPAVFHQQGDVKLFKIKELPADEELIKQNDTILVYGETTGHVHRFEGKAEVYVANTMALLGDGNTIVQSPRKYVIVKDTVQLRHEEHLPQTILPGTYVMDIVYEYDYNKQESRRVID